MTDFSELYTPLPQGITVIDALYTGKRRVGAFYLLQAGDEAAFIETGTNNSLPQALALLDRYKIGRDKVRYVIPTHVHLDHAGGAGGLMEALPNATLLVHPRGARHMVEPERLIAGSVAVFGEENFRAFYGDVRPVAKERIYSPEDNETLYVGDRPLLFRYTPGHANHHFCIWDEHSRGWFTGDNFGLAYPGLACGEQAFLFPTTTPVQFDPEPLKQSLRVLEDKQPEKMYLTHFGALKVEPEHYRQLEQQIDDYVAIARSYDNVERITAALTDYTVNRLTTQGSALSAADAQNQLSADMQMNAQGLAHWRTQQ